MNQANTTLVNPSSWGTMFEDLVPLSTQLVTPALAEAFDIPTARASVPDSQLVHHANPGSGQTKSSYQLPMYNVRSNAGSAQQAQQGAKYYAQPAQPSNPHQDSLGASLGAQGQGGLARQQLQGMGGPGMSQGMYGIKYEDPGAQGYMGLAGQYPNWMDQTTSASGLQPPQTSAKPLEQGTGGSDDPDNGEDYQARALKRPRLVWTAQLHQRFVDAVKQLGLKNAVPKTIMQLMNVDGLTRENVASHLQKYRLQLRKEVGGVDGDNAEDDNLGEGDAAYS